MITHVALFRLGSSLSDAAALDLMARFEALQGQLPGLLTMQAGPNVSPEDFDQGFRHGLVATFADAASFGAYLADEAHVAVARDVIAALVTGPSEDIVAFDLATPGP